MKRLSAICIALILPLAAFCSVFESCVSEIVTNNLAARAELSRAQSQALSLQAENTLAPLEVEFAHKWGSKAEFGNRYTLSVTQAFDWPGVYAARREAAQSGRVALELLAESNILQTRQQTRLLLIEVIHTNKLLAIQEKLVENLDSLEHYFRRAVAAGAETRLDYNKTVLERIAIHRDYHELEARRDELAAQLTALNGGKDVSRIINAVGAEYPRWPESVTSIDIDIIRQRDPEYAAAQANIQSAKAQAKAEKRLCFPGFSIGYEHEVEGPEVFNGFSVGLALPIWGGNRATKAALIEADALTDDADNILAAKIAQRIADLARLESLKTILEEYEPVVNDETNNELLRRALLAGQITFITYLQEINFFTEARRTYFETLYQYNLTLAKLAYLTSPQ